MSTTTSTPKLPPNPDRRVHQKDRARAWKTYRILSKINPGRWHIGIASDRLIMLDVDSIELYNVRKIATFIRSRHGGRMAIFQTKRGYHIVCDRPCSSERTWRQFYMDVMDHCHRRCLPLDFLHAELSLKWGKTVIRLTPKDGDGPPRLVRIL